jgi:hypothetical protein
MPFGDFHPRLLRKGYRNHRNDRTSIALSATSSTTSIKERKIKMTSNPANSWLLINNNWSQNKDGDWVNPYVIGVGQGSAEDKAKAGRPKRRRRRMTRGWRSF